jgi:hypothetical protein
MAAAVSINNTRFPRGFMGKRLIQFFPAYFVIVNQPDGGPARRAHPVRGPQALSCLEEAQGQLPAFSIGISLSG